MTHPAPEERLREQLAETLENEMGKPHAYTKGKETVWHSVTDALLPIIAEHVTSAVQAATAGNGEALSHASGALSDIQAIVTDCVGSKDSPRLQEICEAVLLRIFSSGDRKRTPPSWYRHDWERNAWERYLSGDIKACGYPDIPAKDFSAPDAARLALAQREREVRLEEAVAWQNHSGLSC